MTPAEIRPTGARRPVLITGGAGFTGTNLAHRLLSGGIPVIVLDARVRRKADWNLRWLQGQHQGGLRIVNADARDDSVVDALVRDASHVFHFAVPRIATVTDGPVDADHVPCGTRMVLEAVRHSPRVVPLLYGSSSGAHGTWRGLELVAAGTRDSLSNGARCARGIAADFPLERSDSDPGTAGVAEQYVLDYARSFGMPTTIFRMGCIYGPHQDGGEEQGWIARMVLRALRRKPLTIFGSGKQVRDVLYVDDLIDAILFAQANPRAVDGRVFNVGGGPENTLSVLELVALVAKLQGEVPIVKFASARAADHQFDVANIEAFSSATGWRPRVGVREGIRRLHRWLIEHRVAAKEAERIAPPTAMMAARRDIEVTTTEMS